jgi:putative heme iron utilization protein
MTDATASFPTDHLAPPEALATTPPLLEVDPGRLRTPAEEARALVAANATGTLATLSDDGHPWASFVAYAALGDGAPVFLVSTLAEHGRNLHQRPQASLSIATDAPGDDPLDAGRVTLSGLCRRPDGARAQEAVAAFTEAVPMARHYASFGDFSAWVLDVDRVRWVGGYGRMDSATAQEYRAAEAGRAVGGARDPASERGSRRCPAAPRPAPRRLPGRPQRPVQAL